MTARVTLIALAFMTSNLIQVNDAKKEEEDEEKEEKDGKEEEEEEEQEDQGEK